jgi:SMC interacting uncharacterized protein involved in chromosome segregation
MDIEATIQDLERRSKKLADERTKLDRERAVLESKYDAVVANMKSLGVDIESMGGAEIKKLRSETKEGLVEKLQTIADEIENGEALLEEFKTKG